MPALCPVLSLGWSPLLACPLVRPFALHISVRGCCDKVPQRWELSTPGVYSFTVWKLEVSHQGACSGGILPGLFWLLGDLGMPWLLVVAQPWSLPPASHGLHLRVCDFVFSLLMGTLITRFGTHAKSRVISSQDP